MPNDHPTLEMLADWMSGRLEHEQVLAKILPHLVARCPRCRKLYNQVLALQEEVGHWDESIAVREGQAAPRLLAELLSLELPWRWQWLEEDERFHSWGLCQLLIRKSTAAVFEDPHAAADLAEAAVRLCKFLPPEAYHPDWLRDLTARAWATFGNAQRVLGELRGADAAFRTAAEQLAASASGNTWVEAEISDLLASLRRAQCRLPEALDLLAHAIALYQEAEDLHRVGRALLKKAKVLEEAGELETAIALLAEAPALLDRQREPRLILAARHNLLHLLTLSGRDREAEGLLPEVRQLSREHGGGIDGYRLRWGEGNIARALGRLDEAEAILREVREDLLAQGLTFDAALVSLDLAALHADRGQTAELREIATQLITIFESRNLQRETWIALLLFCQACEEERATAQLALHLAGLLRAHGPRGSGKPASD